MKHSPLVAIAFEKAPKKSKAKKSAEAAPTAMTYEPPSPAERMVERAHSSKVTATSDWIEGRISGDKHKQIHKRADAVIRSGGHVKPEPPK